MKRGLAAGLQIDLDAAILPFIQHRPFDLNGTSAVGRVLDADLTAAARLDTVAEYSVRGQRVCSKARAWVVDLEQGNGAPGVILNGRFDVIRVAPADCVQTQ